MEYNTITTTPNNYNEYCGNRLPCGICRLTNTICPLNAMPTWTSCTTTSSSFSEKGTEDD